MYTLRLVRAAALLLLLVPDASAQDVRLNEFLASNQTGLTDPDFGNTGDWIELYNAGTAPADLGGYFLSDRLDDPTKWRIPDGTTLPAGSYLLIWADDEDTGLHTNFKLSASGESLGLFAPDGAPLDTLTFGPQTSDVSLGRFPDGASAWRFFATPTPGAANDGTDYAGIAPLPVASLPPGFYDGSQLLTLATDEPDAQIHYTLDGSVPTPASPSYDAPLTVSTTSVVRAAVFKDGFLGSPVLTLPFFIDEAVTLPVVSLATDPTNFFDDQMGIYVEGTNGIPGRCRNDPVNWNQDWERPVHVTFFEPDGTLGFSQGMTVAIFGGCSRIYPQKSLALFTRRAHGPAKIDYPVFPDRDLDAYNNLVLRSSAQDWWRTMFRDGMIQTVARQGMDLDAQAYRPALVFLNGEYWGLHNLREKLNEHYLESHHGVDPETVEIIDAAKTPPMGFSPHYDALLAYLGTADLNTPEALAHIGAQMDLEAFLDYLVAQIYSANADWPGNNLKFWRPQTPGGRWRWFFFDLDFGFGGNGQGQFDSNTLALATDPNGPDWPNPPWSTFLIRKLLENDAFRDRFIQRMAAHMNTTFAPDHVVHVIDSLQANIAAEIPRHRARWPQSISFGSDWHALVEIMRTFAYSRPANIRHFFQEQFGLSSSARLTLATDGPTPHGGQIWATGVPMPTGSFSGVFFKDTPLELVARPAPGFVFQGWSGLVTADTDTLHLTLTESNRSLTAHFVRATDVATTPATLPAPTHLAPLFPNPASSQITFSFYLEKPGVVRLQLFDLLGRAVAQVVEGYRGAGPHRLSYQVERLPRGIYFVTFQTAGVRTTRRMILQ